MRQRYLLCSVLGIGAAPGVASADTQDWEVNEVLVSVEGDGAVRYVELYNGPGGCLFPSSRIEAFDADGASLGSAAPSVGTTCFGPDTYFLLATPGAEAAFAVDADHSLVPVLPPAAGQVCFISSATRYDCVRWGAVTTPLGDFFGPDDATLAPAVPDAVALARVATTHVVIDDWDLAAPTPRAPNDGSPWDPPDAGPTPDAATPVDGGALDAAGPLDASGEPDSAAPAADAATAAPDANLSFLDLDPGGGAACGCASADPRTGWPVALALLVVLRGRRRSASPAA